MTLQLDNPAVLFLIFAGFSIWTSICWCLGDKEEYKAIQGVVIIPLIIGVIGAIASLCILIGNSL